MQTKFLKDIAENVAGENAGKIVDLLFGKKDINEFLIAKKLGITINQTRNLLYKLSHLGIISSIRKKDKRKGWYIYFWTLNVLKSLEILEAKLKEEIVNLEAQLKSRKSKVFYKCKVCGREVSEENALLTEFVCQECGDVYDLSDTKLNVEEIEKSLLRLKKQLQLIDSEREIEQNKENKKLEKSIKRGKVAKKLERQKKKQIKDKEMKKNKNFTSKDGKGEKKKPLKNKNTKVRKKKKR